MASRRWGELAWSEVDALDRGRLVAVLPLGAVEAHGPHLPLVTDGVIAEAMAEEGARRLAEQGVEAWVLPTLDYAPAPFAVDFPGTVSVRPETLAATVRDVGEGLARHGVGTLAIANAHLDPAHLGAVHDAVDALRRDGRIRIAFPDLTRKPWAPRLGDEFRSGACHAGRYEGSVVLARRPELVREEVRRRLAPNPRSLSRAIAEGKGDFVEAGGPEAYFGDPAAATAEEGRERVRVLGAILAEAVVEALGEAR